MRQRKSLGFVLALLVGAAGLIGVPAVAGTTEVAAPIAEVRITPGGVDWLPLGEHQGFTLAVGGPQGLILYREFTPGEVPAIGLVDDGGKALPDGVYAYELRPLPRATGPQADGSAAEPTRFLSDYLSVRDGSFVVPATRPEGPAPRSGTSSAASPGVVDAADLVIPENLIVQGNACIGEECVEADAEFIHLKLKGVFPQIVFEDVFDPFSPDRDWAILINDFIGGGEYLAVQDRDTGAVPFTVSGGAPFHSLFVSPTGNLGLGTSVPGAKLHLYGDPTADAAGSAGPNPASGPAFNFGYAGATFGRGAGFLNVRPDASATAPNPSLRFLTANVERMIVTNTGSVGVGTSAPAAPLHVKQAVSGLTMQLEAAGDLFFRQKNSTTGQFVDINLISDEFRINFGTGGAGPELRLTNTGNLIISGTYTPDYVFEPDYELMPLAELAEYVARERHLPNVPNAAEVAEQGLNVNVFPMQLLEKIEELTLYAIAQQETIDELRARLEAIEERDTATPAPGGAPPGI